MFFCPGEPTGKEPKQRIASNPDGSVSTPDKFSKGIDRRPEHERFYKSLGEPCINSDRLNVDAPKFNQARLQPKQVPKAWAIFMNLFSQQIAEIKISYSHRIKPSNQLKIKGSRDVYDYVFPLWHDIEYRESFAILLLSRSLKILGLSWISRGGVAGTVVDPKLIFQTALKANASSIILLHNHPSGALFPSDADRRITEKVKSGGKIMDIEVPDHIILTSESYFSFADDGSM